MLAFQGRFAHIPRRFVLAAGEEVGRRAAPDIPVVHPDGGEGFAAGRNARVSDVVKDDWNARMCNPVHHGVGPGGHEYYIDRLTLLKKGEPPPVPNGPGIWRNCPLMYSMTNFTDDPDALYRWRDEMADLIEEANAK